MGAHSLGLQSGVENLAVMQPVGFSHEAFHAVAVHGMFEKTLRNADNQLVDSIFFCNGKKDVVAFEGRTENTLAVAEQLSNLSFRTEPFLLGEGERCGFSVFWWHVLSRKRP